MSRIKQKLREEGRDLIVLGLIGLALVVLMFHKVPDTNREVVSTIIGGLLTILVGRVSTDKTGSTINQ